ncbi:unnamed protein product, partial [Adineta steineri]
DSSVPEKDLNLLSYLLASKSYKTNTDDDSQDEFLQQTTTDQSGKKDKRPKLLRPNAFLSFRITNQQV